MTKSPLGGKSLTLCAFGFVCLTQPLEGQGLSQYRSFELGSNLSSVSTLARIAPSEAKLIHQRPAVLQELEWRPSRWIGSSTVASSDPVERVLFCFYNDQLFRVEVDYSRERTAGMTSADMVDAIAKVYGTGLPLPFRTPGGTASQRENDSGTPVGRWGDTAHAVVLYQTSSYRSAFRMIVTDVHLDDLARKAETQARRLDEEEAPRRELARQKKERDDGQTATEKARITNKESFRP